MKNIFIFLSFVFGTNFMFSQNDSIHKKLVEEKRIYYYENCKKDSLRAISDSELENKYYINMAAPYGDEFLPENEFKVLLKKNNITWGGYWMGSDIGGYNGECYEIYMTEETEKKFGRDFLDDLLKTSVSNYIKKNPDLIFKSNDFLEWSYNGRYLDFLNGNDDLNKAFFSTFSYPDDYQFYKIEDKYKSLSDVAILLDEKGKVLKIIRINHHIYNSKNNKFIIFLEKKLKTFVKTTKFIPATYSGVPVKAEINLRIYYK